MEEDSVGEVGMRGWRGRRRHVIGWDGMEKKVGEVR